MRHSIVFAGQNTFILDYLSRRRDLRIAHCFVHEKSGDPSAFMQCCLARKLPFSVVADNRGIRSVLERLEPADLGIVSGFEILSEDVYSWPKRGFVNLHPSYLPFYRGANPFYHMLVRNEKKGGVSIHQITGEIDGGAIFCRARYPIAFEEDISVLIKKADDLAVELLERHLGKILKGMMKKIPNCGGSYFPPVRKKQAIDRTMSPLQIHNLVRSQTIYGGCFLKLKQKTVCVEKVAWEPRTNNSVFPADSRQIRFDLADGSSVMLRVKDTL